MACSTLAAVIPNAFGVAGVGAVPDVAIGVEADGAFGVGNAGVGAIEAGASPRCDAFPLGDGGVGRW